MCLNEVKGVFCYYFVLISILRQGGSFIYLCLHINISIQAYVKYIYMLIIFLLNDRCIINTTHKLYL